MLLHKCIITPISSEGLSGIYVKTKSYDHQEIKNFLYQTFNREWTDALKMVETVYGNCYETENDWPSGIDLYDKDCGVFVTLPALFILYDGGKKCDKNFANTAFENTLNALRKKYPDIHYSGYIAFVDIDGNMIQREIYSSENERLQRYDFIAEAIGFLNENVDVFMDAVLNQCFEQLASNWIIELIDLLHLYEDMINTSVYDRISEIVCDYIEDDELYEQFEFKIESWKTSAADKH